METMHSQDAPTRTVMRRRRRTTGEGSAVATGDAGARPQGVSTPGAPVPDRPISTAEKTGETGEGSPHGSRERTRELTDRKIVQAALEIAVSQGVSAVTIEEVARRSGVAKTTIYRRYRNTADMLSRLRTLTIVGSSELAGLEPSRGNLLLLLQRVMERFTTDVGIRAVGVVLASDNAFFHGIIGQVIIPEQRRFSEFLRRGELAGVFRHGLHPGFLFSTIMGSLVAYRALPGDDEEARDDMDAPRHEPSWAEQMTSLLWPTIATTT